MLQEFKITNTQKSTDTFFFAHSFKSAKYYADEYIDRNKGKFPMKLFALSRKPKPFPRWEFLKTA